MHTPKSIFIEREGVRLHALDHGDPEKPVLFFVHGAAAHSHWWDRLAPRFGDHFRPVAVDLRGHGDSDWTEDYSYKAFADDLDAWIRWAGAETGRPPGIVAHSLGAVITLKLHEWNPPALTGLVIVDAPLTLGERIISRVRKLGRNPSRPWTSADLFVEKFRLVPTSGKADPAEIAHIAQHSIRPLENGTWLLKTDKSFHRDRKPTDLRPGWKNISGPVMLILGEHSDRMSKKDISWVESICPGVEVATINGTDHHVYLDAPDSFLRAIRDFFSRCLP